MIWHLVMIVLTGVWGKRGGTRTTRRSTAWRTRRRWKPKQEHQKWSAAYQRRARGASRGESRGRSWTFTVDRHWWFTSESSSSVHILKLPKLIKIWPFNLALGRV